jgi:hypothetical protein
MNQVLECLQTYQTDLLKTLKTTDMLMHNHPPINTLQMNCAYCRLHGNVAMHDMLVRSETDGVYAFLKK